MKLPEHRHPHLAVLESFEDELREVITHAGALLRPELGLLRWMQEEGDTFIAAVPVPNNAAEPDEMQPICMLTISSLLKTQPRLSDEQINACNRLAGLSALTRQKNQQQVMAATTFTFYDDPAQRAHVMYLAVQTTFLQRSWLSSVLAGLEHDFRRPVPYFCPVTGTEPSRWGHDELGHIYQQLIDGGYKARFTDQGIVAVLNKHNVRGQGSFLQVRNDIQHGLYGNGLSVTFVLPEEPDASIADLERRCLEWNREEVHTILPVPSIGAWTTLPGRHQMQHHVFVPNVVHASEVGHLATDAAIQRWAARMADSLREM